MDILIWIVAKMDVSNLGSLALSPVKMTVVLSPSVPIIVIISVRPTVENSVGLEFPILDNAAVKIIALMEHANKDH